MLPVGYASWSGLNRSLRERLCPELRGRVTYFLTRYHRVHNSYGRASVRIDGREVVNFGWWEMGLQERAVEQLWKETGEWNPDAPSMKQKTEEGGIYSDYDFLSAATEYLCLSVSQALFSENPIIRMFGILDRRVGKRTLVRLRSDALWENCPPWLKVFYALRTEASGVSAGD